MCTKGKTNLVIVILVFGYLLIFIGGIGAGYESAKWDATIIVCNRAQNNAPREWCEKTIIMETLKK